MEINGHDISIPVKPTKDIVNIVLHKMKSIWEDFTIEIVSPQNFFIYENSTIQEYWDAQPEYKNKMLEFIIDNNYKDEHYLILVCDEPDDFINDLAIDFSILLK